MQKTTFIVASLVVLLPWISSAESKVTDCQGNFAGAAVMSLNLSTEIKSIDQLPKKIYVAQSADYLISSKSSEMKLWGRQSFVNGEEKVMCATLRDPVVVGFSMYAPTLIDLTESHEVGNSFWQFHMTADGTKAGIWNQKSRFVPHSNDFLIRMQANGIKVYGEMVSSVRYQLHFVRESAAATEHLRIRYDLTNDLP